MYDSIRRLFYILILVWFATGVSAQIEVGILGGLNSSKLFGDSPAGVKYKGNIGIYSGIQLDYYVHPNVAISFQPSYSMEGASVHYNVKGIPELVDSGKIGLNYLRFPLLAKINFNNNRFYALAGFDFGMLANAKVKMNNKDEADINEELIKSDFSFHTGIGYRWHIHSVTLFLEGRYIVGIKNITDQSNTDYGLAPRIKNGGLKILFGVEVPLWNPENNN